MDGFVLAALIASAGILAGVLAIGLALRYGGDYPLRAAGDFVTSIINILIGRPIYLLRLSMNGREEWVDHQHSVDYIQHLEQRREEEEDRVRLGRWLLAAEQEESEEITDFDAEVEKLIAEELVNA